MNRYLAVVGSLVFAGPIIADQPESKKGIDGYWLGTVQVGAIERRLGFKFETKDGKLSATMDSIDQEVNNIPLDTATFVDNTLTVKFAKAKITYTGKLQPDGDTIKGEYEQGIKLPLDLKRQDKPFELKRPQNPKKPYPYVEEKLSFDSKAKDVKLAATFTKPKGDGPFPAVALITGSGPQDRDESLMGHKPFLVIADYLTRRGHRRPSLRRPGRGQVDRQFREGNDERFRGRRGRRRGVSQESQGRRQDRPHGP